ncbi:MAG TPA: ComEA family DNA-binding protein [Chloroflexia bacterium]|nr:ComEA family DNA-binding protein [Chloroflexia bacterium]
MATTPKSSPDSKSEPGMHVSKRALLLAGPVVLIFLIGVGILVSKLADKEATGTNGSQQARAAITTRAALTATAGPTASPTPDKDIKVYITGAVLKPGVYQMQAGDRILDAVNVAGGFSPDADQQKLDQAQRVKDEMRIEVPRLPATISETTGEKGAVATTVAPTVTPSDGRINVNTASVAELDKLPGIGQTLAQRIMEYRTNNGPFKDIEDLRKVSGITKSTIDKIKDLVTF